MKNRTLAMIPIILFFIFVVLGYLWLSHSNEAEVPGEDQVTLVTESVRQYLDEIEIDNPEKNTGRSEEVRYVEVVDGCDFDFSGQCAYTYLEPDPDSATTTDLRTGMVFRVDETINRGDDVWYRVTFEDQWIRYPKRITGEMYVKEPDVEPVFAPPTMTTWEDGASSTNKMIIVDKSEQRLYAYQGDELIMEMTVSTGLQLSPTTVGTYSIFKKTPSRYMQGPIEGVAGSDYYDLAGVPWNLYFTEDGAVIHGTYWHESFGQRYSHGCVNLPPAEAEKLYNWAPLRTTVIVQD